MEAGNPSDEQLWDACRNLPSDWEPFGKRRWLGPPQERPDCTTCCWLTELFRTWSDWGVCANPGSPRAGLLTFREQGCWQHEPRKERCCLATRTARCGFMRVFESLLREQAAAFIRDQVRRANDPSPEDEPPAPTLRQVRKTPLFAVIRRLLRHADDDFTRTAFDAMTARARKDSRRYWESALCYWARTAGEVVPQIRLPVNMPELEQEFWRRADAAITEALRGRSPRHSKKRRRSP